jgi:signal transduction histidine kinase
MRLKNIFDSIAFRISISIAVIVAATAMTVGWMILKEQLRVQEHELKNQGRYLAELMAQQIVEPLLYEERYRIFSLLQAPMEGEESLVVYAEVYNTNGEVIVSAFKDEKYHTMIPPHDFKDLINHTEIDDPMIYHINLPITISTFETIGFLRIGITKEFFLIAHKKVKRKLYLLASAIIFVGVMLGLWIAKKIIKPILVLHKGVKRVGEGEVGVEIPLVGEGEIKELALSFNKMSKKLKELIDTIKSAQEHLIRTEKLYAVGEFSAGVAHEIKNPLTSIKMIMQTVKQKRQILTDRDIEVIEEEINRIDRIVKEFLAFARPEKAEKTDVNINKLLDEVITVTKPKIEQSKIQLVHRFTSPLPMIKGNHDALKQVFLNIVLNSIQAMDGVGGMLTIESSADEGAISIIVKDTGIGIPKENLSKIFNPFFTTKRDGTGMGLAIAYNIINDHSGKIEVNSSLGNGTTVKVVLPL